MRKTDLARTEEDDVDGHVDWRVTKIKHETIFNKQMIVWVKTKEATTYHGRVMYPNTIDYHDTHMTIVP
jgi:hypothetical protein